MTFTRYRVDLTPHERAALLAVLAEHCLRPDAIDASVDAATGERVEIADLLARLLNLEPSIDATLDARARGGAS